MTAAILSITAVLLGLAAALGMAWLVLVCLIRCRRQQALAIWSAVFMAALMVLIVGGAVLRAVDLAWRSRTIYALCAVLLAGGMGMMVSAIRLLPELLAQWPERTLRAWQCDAWAACCLAMLGLLVLGRWLLVITTGEERVVTREGCQMVEVDEGWMDYYMVYCPYRGPLVRGGTALEIEAESKLLPKEAVG